MDLLLDSVQKISKHLQAFADLFLMINDNGLVLECNLGNPSILFDLSEQLRYKQVQSILPVETGANLEDFLSQARKNGRSSSIEFSLTVGERDIWFDGYFVPDSNTGFILSARDITKYKETESRMKRQLQRLSALRSIDLAIAP